MGDSLELHRTMNPRQWIFPFPLLGGGGGKGSGVGWQALGGIPQKQLCLRQCPGPRGDPIQVLLGVRPAETLSGLGSI